MFEGTVWCPNDDCREMFTYTCEWESAEGSHEAECPFCGSLISFEIEYSPDIFNESLVD